MVYYLFRFNEEDIQENRTKDFIKFLDSLITKDNEILDYLPSKRRVIISQIVNVDEEIESYARCNCDFKFEYEMCEGQTRKLIQFDPSTKEKIFISYLLSLFPAEDLLKL